MRAPAKVAVFNPSQSAHQQQNDDDQHDHPKYAGRPVTPVAAVGPSWKCANQHQYQDNQQYGSEAHDVLLNSANEATQLKQPTTLSPRR